MNIEGVEFNVDCFTVIQELQAIGEGSSQSIDLAKNVATSIKGAPLLPEIK